jgi:hypothetical protein
MQINEELDENGGNNKNVDVSKIESIAFRVIQ